MTVALVLALLICAPWPPAPLAERPCSGDDAWLEAQGSIHAVDVTEPIVGISALVVGLAEDSFPSCAASDEQPNEGWAGLTVNLSRYDRRTARGGELIQLGIVRPHGEQPRFTKTEDSTGGGMILMDAPRPELGHTYRLSIEAAAGSWVFEIYDETAGESHEWTQAARWTDVGSAFVMHEVFAHGSPFGGWRSPMIVGTELLLASGALPVTPACELATVWYRDPHSAELAAYDRFAFSEGVAGASCSSVPFVAFGG